MPNFHDAVKHWIPALSDVLFLVLFVLIPIANTAAFLQLLRRCQQLVDKATALYLFSKMPHVHAGAFCRRDSSHFVCLRNTITPPEVPAARGHIEFLGQIWLVADRRRFRRWTSADRAFVRTGRRPGPA